MAASDTQVVLATDRFDADLAHLVDDVGFRIDAIFPADAPDTAIVSNDGVRVRLVAADHPSPVTLRVASDRHVGERRLPGGSTIQYARTQLPLHVPDNVPTLTVSHADGEPGIGRAGMRYRDLLPDRWGGRFIASLISIPDGGPVPDYVHFHRIRFQLIFVKSGWVRVVYEDQGEPFVLHAGDGVIQPPEIRHRVLEASPGLEVVEIGCPAWHETIADHALALPHGLGPADRSWDGQRFVRPVSADAPHRPWRIDGWEYRDTGVAAATDGLAGVRVARPAADAVADPAHVTHDTEFAQLVVLTGAVTFETDDRTDRLVDGSAVAIPGGVHYRLTDVCPGTELLDVTLPA